MKSINFNNLLIILIKINHIMLTIKWIIIILYFLLIIILFFIIIAQEFSLL